MQPQPLQSVHALQQLLPDCHAQIIALTLELWLKSFSGKNSGEVEERLSRPEQVEGDLITMRKSDCNMPQSRTACLRELCMPRIQEEPSVYAYTYLYTQTQHIRDSRRGH